MMAHEAQSKRACVLSDSQHQQQQQQVDAPRGSCVVDDEIVSCKTEIDALIRQLLLLSPLGQHGSSGEAAQAEHPPNGTGEQHKDSHSVPKRIYISPSFALLSSLLHQPQQPVQHQQHLNGPIVTPPSSYAFTFPPPRPTHSANVGQAVGSSSGALRVSGGDATTSLSALAESSRSSVNNSNRSSRRNSVAATSPHGTSPRHAVTTTAATAIGSVPFLPPGTVLHNTATSGETAADILLSALLTTLENEADMPRNYNGATPLHLAAAAGYADACAALINSTNSAGEDSCTTAANRCETSALTMQDRDGRAPLDLAIEEGHKQTTQLLLRHMGVSDPLLQEECFERRYSCTINQQHILPVLHAPRSMSSAGVSTQSKHERIDPSSVVADMATPLTVINATRSSAIFRNASLNGALTSSKADERGGCTKNTTHQLAGPVCVGNQRRAKEDKTGDSHRLIVQATTPTSSHMSSVAPDPLLTGQGGLSALCSRYSSLSDVRPVVVCMVGLPGRGKSYMARHICRYLRWKGVPSRVFNAGDYRRLFLGAEQTNQASFYDPNNVEASQLREKMAQKCCDDAAAFLNSIHTMYEAPASTPAPIHRRKVSSEVFHPAILSPTTSQTKPSPGADAAVGLSRNNLAVAFIDATNTTMERRQQLRRYFRREVPNARCIFLESICEDPDIIIENIVRAKCGNDDFSNNDPLLVIDEFQKRIGQYRKIYESVDFLGREAHLATIQIKNVKRHITLHRVEGVIPTRITWFLLNLHNSAKPIFICLPGETVGDSQERFGGAPELSANGRMFAASLAEFLVDKMSRYFFDSGAKGGMHGNDAADDAAEGSLGEAAVRRMIRNIIQQQKKQERQGSSSQNELDGHEASAAAEDYSARENDCTASSQSPLQAKSQCETTMIFDLHFAAGSVACDETVSCIRQAFDQFNRDVENKAQLRTTTKQGAASDANSMHNIAAACGDDEGEFPHRMSSQHVNNQATTTITVNATAHDALNEIHYGAMEGQSVRDALTMHPKRMERLYPDYVHIGSTTQRKAHPLMTDSYEDEPIPIAALGPRSYHNTYQQGESSRMVVVRLEPMLMVLARAERPTVIVCPKTPAQGLIAYLTGLLPEQLHCIDLNSYLNTPSSSSSSRSSDTSAAGVAHLSASTLSSGTRGGGGDAGKTKSEWNRVVELGLGGRWHDIAVHDLDTTTTAQDGGELQGCEDVHGRYRSVDDFPCTRAPGAAGGPGIVPAQTESLPGSGVSSPTSIPATMQMRSLLSVTRKTKTQHINIKHIDGLMKSDLVKLSTTSLL